MTMTRTLTAAGAQSFAVVAQGDTATDGGFLLSEDNVSAIEATLSKNETSIATLTKERDDATAASKTAATNLATANATIATRDATITNLEGEVAKLKAGPATTFTAVPAGEDPAAKPKAEGKEKYHTSYDAEAARYSRK